MSRTITIVDDDEGYSVTAQVSEIGCTHLAVTSVDPGRALPSAVVAAIQTAVVSHLALLAGPTPEPPPASNGATPPAAAAPAAAERDPAERPTPKEFAAAWKATKGGSTEARIRELAAWYNRSPSTVRNWRSYARSHGANVN